MVNSIFILFSCFVLTPLLQVSIKSEGVSCIFLRSTHILLLLSPMSGFFGSFKSANKTAAAVKAITTSSGTKKISAAPTNSPQPKQQKATLDLVPSLPSPRVIHDDQVAKSAESTPTKEILHALTDPIEEEDDLKTVEAAFEPPPPMVVTVTPPAAEAEADAPSSSTSKPVKTTHHRIRKTAKRTGLELGVVGVAKRHGKAHVTRSYYSVFTKPALARLKHRAGVPRVCSGAYLRTMAAGIACLRVLTDKALIFKSHRGKRLYEERDVLRAAQFLRMSYYSENTKRY